MSEKPSCKDGRNKNTPWPDRLKVSATSLCQLSRQLQDAINDERRFAILTDLAPSEGPDKETMAEYTEFGRLLREALTALIDLSAYNNPEQEYPDLTKWFKFECPNASYGMNTCIISSEGNIASFQPPRHDQENY